MIKNLLLAQLGKIGGCYEVREIIQHETLHMKPIIAKQDEVSKVENMGIHDPAVVEELLHSGIYVLDDSIDSNALIELQSNVESRFGEIKIVYIILTDVCNLRCSYCAVKNIADKNHVIDTYNLTYACSIVALSNLMKYYRSRGYTSISSNFKTLYNSLWNHAGTSSDGSTTNGKEPKAAKKYLSEVGYSCSYSSFKAYSKFVSNLDSNKPCLFTYGAKFGDHKGGHAVFVAGYVDTSSYQYLKIADGWNSYLRYINFNGYSYSRKNGWAFTISG